MSKKAPRIPDETWDRYKQEIIAHYLEAGSTLEHLMLHMDRNHGFRASKNQYTTKLKKWRIAKNSKASIWCLVGMKVKKRTQRGKKSAVSLHGRLQMDSKVQKEIARNVTFTSTLQSLEDAPTPEGVSVFTPLADSLALNHREVYIDNLPSVQFRPEVQFFIQNMLGERLPFYNARFPGATLHTTMENPHNQSYSYNYLTTMTNRMLTAQTTELDRTSKSIENSNNRDVQRNLEILSQELLPITPFDTVDKRKFLFTYLLPEAVCYKEVCSNGISDNFGPLPQLSNPALLMNCFMVMLVNNLLKQDQISSLFQFLKKTIDSVTLANLCWLKPPFLRIFQRKIFRSAVESGETLLVGKIIENGVHPDSFRRWSPLSIAVRKGDLAMVELLCKAGAKPQVESIDVSVNFFTRTALWEPAKLPILHTLLTFGADPECFVTDKKRGFPLINAALVGSIGAVNLLVNKGARVNTYVPHYYGTALQAATAQGNLELVETLIQLGADINVPESIEYEEDKLGRLFLDYDGEDCALQTPMQIAAERDDTLLFQLLLDYGASANACTSYTMGTKFSTAMQYAAENQNFKIITLLLSVGVHPDSRVGTYRDTPLQISARLGNQEIVSLLLMAGADVNAPPANAGGRTAIQAAAESGSIPLVRILLQHGAQLNAPAAEIDGMTALQAAAKKGHAFMIGFLYSMGADLNAALHAAAAGGHIELLEDLIKLGGDVNAPGVRGEKGTALQVSIRHEKLSIIALLIQNGADVNAPDSPDYGTAIEEASRYEWLDGAKYLLEHGADVNYDEAIFDILESSQGALAWAIVNDNSEMVKLFLDNGADVIITSNIGHSNALIHALENNASHEILSLLLERDGVLDITRDDESALAYAIDGINVEQAIQLIIDRLTTLPKDLRDRHICLAWDQLPPEDWDAEELSRILEILLDAGSDINSQHHKTKSTLLQRIVVIEHMSGIEKGVISFLLDKGAEVNVPATSNLGTPLQSAIKLGDINVINIFLEHGVDVNASPATDGGATALQAAAIKGMIQVAITLLQRGADVAAPAAPVNGRTAIDGAAEHGRWDMLQLLLNAYEGSEDLRTVCMRAAAYAQVEDHIEIAEWLENYSGA